MRRTVARWSSQGNGCPDGHALSTPRAGDPEQLRGIEGTHRTLAREHAVGGTRPTTYRRVASGDGRLCIVVSRPFPRPAGPGSVVQFSGGSLSTVGSDDDAGGFVPGARWSGQGPRGIVRVASSGHHRSSRIVREAGPGIDGTRELSPHRHNRRPLGIETESRIANGPRGVTNRRPCDRERER